MKIYDLSDPIDASKTDVDVLTHEVLSPRQGALHMASEMMSHFDIEFDPDTLPDGEFLSLDRLSLTSHTGTHVDAPSHYGSNPGSTSRPLDIDQVQLDWFFRPGVVIDVRDLGMDSYVTAETIRSKLANMNYALKPLDIVLFDTGASKLSGTPEYFKEFPGLDRSAISLLLEAGVRVVGTDAFSLDAPFARIIDAYSRSSDRSVLWPAHFAGCSTPYCQIERLKNLDSLPRKFDFTVCCFPVAIAGAGAGWTRAVALFQ